MKEHFLMQEVFFFIVTGSLVPLCLGYLAQNIYLSVRRYRQKPKNRADTKKSLDNHRKIWYTFTYR